MKRPFCFAAPAAASAGGAVGVVPHVVQHSLRCGLLHVLLRDSSGLSM